MCLSHQVANSLRLGTGLFCTLYPSTQHNAWSTVSIQSVQNECLLKMLYLFMLPRAHFPISFLIPLFLKLQNSQIMKFLCVHQENKMQLRVHLTQDCPGEQIMEYIGFIQNLSTNRFIFIDESKILKFFNKYSLRAYHV